MSTFPVAVYGGAELLSYGYDEKPWFLPNRAQALFDELARRGLDRRVELLTAPPADDADILLFHSRAHLDFVRLRCAEGTGAFDNGATPARPHVETAATHMVGAVMDAARRILAGDLERAFVPIAGFHHAHREQARKYCLYNDPAIVISHLLRVGVAPVAYVDVDVHHGDGVYVGFAGEPDVIIADIHEDERTIWPHSPEEPGDGPFPGDRTSCGEGAARGTKLNLPLPAGAGDAGFRRAIDEAVAFITPFRPAFVVFESGADGLEGDPFGHLGLTAASLTYATRRLRALADETAGGRLLVVGGGGYELRNLVAGFTAVIEALIAP